MIAFEQSFTHIRAHDSRKIHTRRLTRIYPPHPSNRLIIRPSIHLSIISVIRFSTEERGTVGQLSPWRRENERMLAESRFFKEAQELDDSEEVEEEEIELWEEREGETMLVRTLLLKVAPRVKTTARRRRRAKRGIEMKRNAKETGALDLPNGGERSIQWSGIT